MSRPKLKIAIDIPVILAQYKVAKLSGEIEKEIPSTGFTVEFAASLKHDLQVALGATFDEDMVDFCGGLAEEVKTLWNKKYPK